MNWIVSSIPGRLRLRSRALRERDSHARLQALLEDRDGTLAVEGSINAGSLLMRYDAARVDRTTMEAQVTAAAAGAGLLSPITTAMLHNGSTIAILLNALRRSSV